MPFQILWELMATNSLSESARLNVNHFLPQCPHFAHTWQSEPRCGQENRDHGRGLRGLHEWLDHKPLLFACPGGGSGELVPVAARNLAPAGSSRT